MALLINDELNNISKSGIVERKIKEIEDYFNEMELPEEQKKDRILFAHKLENILLFIFALIPLQKGKSAEEIRAYVVEQFLIRYTAIIPSGELDNYIRIHIINSVNDVIDTTIDNLTKEEGMDLILDNSENISDWWLSGDRALFIACCETNAIKNYTDFNNAIKSGMNYKTWHSKADSRVRKTHIPLNGVKKQIKEIFVVGNSLMMFPGDESLGASAKEIVNCRCSCTYSKN